MKLICLFVLLFVPLSVSAQTTHVGDGHWLLDTCGVARHVMLAHTINVQPSSRGYIAISDENLNKAGVCTGFVLATERQLLRDGKIRMPETAPLGSAEQAVWDYLRSHAGELDQDASVLVQRAFTKEWSVPIVFPSVTARK
jgi:hypothetical protein